jgi:hypothetical protein
MLMLMLPLQVLLLQEANMDHQARCCCVTKHIQHFDVLSGWVHKQGAQIAAASSPAVCHSNTPEGPNSAAVLPRFPLLTALLACRLAAVVRGNPQLSPGP